MRKILTALLATILLLVMPSTFGGTTIPVLSPELRCLADNIYFEAKGESFKGKLAVAVVTLNRVKSGNYPNTICKVVYQPYQFSWTKTKRKVTNFYAWTDSLLAATMAMEDPKILGNFQATHYHNTTVSPNWGLRRVARIGQHIFYRA